MGCVHMPAAYCRDLPFAWSAPLLSKNLVPLFYDSPHTSGNGSHTPPQTPAGGWWSSRPTKITSEKKMEGHTIFPVRKPLQIFQLISLVMFAVHTSFWMVSLTLILFEWGSVHTKPASMRCTLLSPFSRVRQMRSNSLDSSAQDTHVFGGRRYLGECDGNKTFISPLQIGNHKQIFWKLSGHAQP